MGDHIVRLNGVDIPVDNVGVTDVSHPSSPFSNANTELLVEAEGACIETEKLGDLLEALLVDVPPYADDAAVAPEAVCLAFGGHFWTSPDIQMEHKAERRVCGVCDKIEKKVEKWVDDE